MFKILQISGVYLDFRGVKKRQGGWGKKFSNGIDMESVGWTTSKHHLDISKRH
jgi:hypothetical protein